ncbi:MAG: IclR family transcriptional regulator [Kineosporiaceae bacterium]
MAGRNARPGRTVTDKALALLGAFDGDHRELRLSELARRAEVPMATAHRLVGELAAWGALTRRPSGGYTIGQRLWDLGLLAPKPAGLRETASPFLHDLYAATRATVHLAVRDGTEALYLDRVSGHGSVHVVSHVGSRLPLHATGVGKVLLAHAPEAVQREVLGHLTRVTPHTVVQPGRLAQQLRRVRSENLATTVEEMTLGACSLAVPVRAEGGSPRPGERPVVAAVGVVVPDLRRDRARLLAALRVAVAGISRVLPPAS